MEQVYEFTEKMTGAAGDDIFDGDKIALEAYGDRAKDKNSGLLAFSYLWRRFGPPWLGTDPHKKLVDYTLTTADPEVFLCMSLSASGLALCVSYRITRSLEAEHFKPWKEWESRFEEWWWKQHPEFEALDDTEENREKAAKVYWAERCKKEVTSKAVAAIGEFPRRAHSIPWREAGGVVTRANQAIFDALKELERPVYVRDIPINLFGRCDDSEESCEPSVYAGYGVGKPALDALLKDDA